MKQQTIKMNRNIFDSNQVPIILFFVSLFIFISFAGTRLFFSDEGVILDQFYNLINGSLAIKIAKINTAKGIFFLIGDNLYGMFSYSLLILSLPVYYFFRLINSLFGAHFFMLQLWALSGGITTYIIAKIYHKKHSKAIGIITFFILFLANLFLFKPIYFPKWGELLSIEFVNILISSFLVVFVYLLFKNFFNDKIAIFSSIFIIIATPIPFYAITLKHHNLAVFLTVLTFYLFCKFIEKNDNKYIYFAYLVAGLCTWTRILDGAALLISLVITDIIFLRRGLKNLLITSVMMIFSMLPFFIFNYLYPSSPFLITETFPLADKSIQLPTAKDFISLEESPSIIAKQAELQDRLGFEWGEKIKGDLFEIFGNITILKFNNTFGIFLVSPFIVISLAFLLDRKKNKLKLNVIDKFFGLFIITFIVLYKNSLPSILSDTPMVLEYRYLLVLYIILFYFALRIDKLRELIDKNLKNILLLSISILLFFLIYFIIGFPISFLDIVPIGTNNLDCIIFNMLFNFI